MSCAARSDRPLYARNQHLQPGQNRHGVDPAPRFPSRKRDPAAFRGTRSALGATFEAADKYGWTLVHPVSANPNPSGIVTDDALEQIAGMILEAADTKGPVDGALLHLHGAIVTKAHEEGQEMGQARTISWMRFPGGGLALSQGHRLL